jgi:hypothetical protein
MTDFDHRVPERPPRPHNLDWRPTGGDPGRGRSGRRRLGLSALLVLLGGLAIGVWQHYTLHLQVMAAAEQHHDFVPRVRVAAVQASPGTRADIDIAFRDVPTGAREDVGGFDERDIARHHQRFRCCVVQPCFTRTESRPQVTRASSRFALAWRRDAPACAKFASAWAIWWSSSGAVITARTSPAFTRRATPIA